LVPLFDLATEIRGGSRKVSGVVTARDHVAVIGKVEPTLVVVLVIERSASSRQVVTQNANPLRPVFITGRIASSGSRAFTIPD
jgi:hypothetical protein